MSGSMISGRRSIAHAPGGRSATALVEAMAAAAKGLLRVLRRIHEGNQGGRAVAEDPWRLPDLQRWRKTVAEANGAMQKAMLGGLKKPPIEVRLTSGRLLWSRFGESSVVTILPPPLPQKDAISRHSPPRLTVVSRRGCALPGRDHRPGSAS
jgi:hypothetical protein